MKNLIAFGFLALTLWSCKKENEPDNNPNIPYFDFKIYNPGDQKNGSASATVFGKEWNASAYIARYPDSTSQFFEVHFETYSDFGETRDHIGFGVFKGQKGEYEITNNPFDPNFDDFSIACVYGLWISDGDLLYGNYFMDTNYKSKVIIDKNDGEFIEGRFWLIFTSNVVEHTDIPGRIYFEEGKFRVKL
jgi:hypothetical protein